LIIAVAARRHGQKAQDTFQEEKVCGVERAGHEKGPKEVCGEASQDAQEKNPKKGRK